MRPTWSSVKLNSSYCYFLFDNSYAVQRHYAYGDQTPTFVIHLNYLNVGDLSILWYIIQIWMISAFVLQKANKIIHFWIICTIQIWIKVSLLLGHSKLGIVSVQPILMILNISLHDHETPKNTMRHHETPCMTHHATHWGTNRCH